MASILKSQQSSQPVDGARGMTGLAGFNLDDLAAAGVRQLKAVEAQAEQILHRAREEAVALKQRAEHEAREAGYAAGMQHAEQEIERRVAQQVDQQVPAIRSAMQQISDVQEAYLNDYRQLLTSTVLAATERMVADRLRREPEMVVRWAESLLQYAKTAVRVTLAVHPETLVRHGEALEALLNAPGMPEESRIEPDESVEPAGVVVRTDQGMAERTLHSQLERLDQMLREADQ